MPAWPVLGLSALLVMSSSSPAALIGYWTFDEGTGTVAGDTSGRATPLNGTLSSGGGGLPLWTAGRFGNALDFNFTSLSAGGLVTVPYNGDLRLSNAFTISFWWRPDYVPAASTFPGIVRIGSQSPVPPAANAGWGFFRSQPNTARFKRGNHQPDVWRPALAVGQWHHIALTHDGSGNNVAFVNGQTATFATNWPALTTTANLEFGRMDSFDNAGLDDFALFNEGLSLAKVRSIYTLPLLGPEYNVADMRAVWAIFDAGAGASGTVKGITWSHTTVLPGSTALGDAYLSGNAWFVVLGSGAGVTATAQLLGDVSPAGIGLPGTLALTETPAIGASARFVFDLGGTTEPGGGANDLITIAGDLNLSGNTVAVNPLASLANGTYRLFSYTGSKSGSFNPVVVHSSRYTLTLDDATSGQVNLLVSGAPGDLRWTSTNNASWDLTTTNWFNTGTASPDRFFQADAVRWDDSAPVQTNLTLATAVYPGSVTVDSSTLNFSLTGAGRLGGAGQGITKNGSSLLTLGGAGNTFVGAVNLNAGTLRLAGASVLGATNGATFVAAGATLDLGGFAQGAEPVSVQGLGLSGTGAVINTGGALVNDGLRGPMTLTGDTTFGGPNRWDVFGGSLAGQGYQLTKSGAAEIALSNLRDTGLGDIEVQQGQLTILGSTLMGDPARGVAVRPGATLAHWASGTNVHQKPLALEWARLLNNTTPAGDVATNAASVSLVGTNSVDGASSVALLGEVSGTGALVKSGAGTLHLGGTNTYTGPTTVNVGALALAGEGTVATTPVITLGTGARLNAATRVDGTLTLASGQTLTGNGTVEGKLAAGTGAFVAPGFSAGTLTVTNDLNLTGGATLVYELGAVTTEGAGVNDLINVGGALTLAGTTTLKILPVGSLDTANPYTVISYAGALSGSAANLDVVSDSRMTFAVDTASTAGKVKLSVTAGVPAELEWVGGELGAETSWDVQTTPNWLSTVTERFYAGDTVKFNDLATEFTVNLVGDLFPGETRVEADANDFTFTGSGRLRGGGLKKSLGGRLTLANTGLNDYPGPTVISGGTVQVGRGGTEGSLGPAAVTNNGRLVFNRSDDLTLVNTLVGTGTLEKQGANLLNLPASLAGFDGTVLVSAGVARPTATNGLGTAAGGTVVASGGTLDVNGLNLSTEPVTVAGAGVGGNGAVVNSGAGQINALTRMTLGGDTTFGGINRWDVRGAPATFEGGNFNLTKVGANEVWIVDAGESELANITVSQGVLGIQGTTTLGDALATVTVAPGATLGFWGLNANVVNKRAAFDNGTLRNDNGVNTFAGPIDLTGSNVFTASAVLTLAGPITGTGSLNKFGTGTNILASDNAYAGGTVVAAGALFLGTGGTAGSVTGDILNSASLYYHRSDAFTLANNITGPGNVFLRTAGGLVLDGTAQVNIGGNLEVGRDLPGKLIIRAGAQPFAARINLGNIANTPGELIQEGGDVYVSTEVRVGHWPTETSTYLLGGGTLNLTNVPTGTATERSGLLYIGVDGTGIFTQTGGVATAHGIVLDNRTDTAGTDTFNLEGGTFRVGPSGLASANPSYQVNLGGGRLAATAHWASSLRMTLTGTSGDVILDTGANSNSLSGVLSGPGGLRKEGAGVLVLNGVNTYLGTTLVSQGTLMGTGTLAGPVVVAADGTLSPGLSLGTLTLTSNLTLEGTTVMEIQKSGATLASDLITGAATLTYGGSLTVLASGDPLASGDTFNLFDAATFREAFRDVRLPDLPPGLFWDTSRLTLDGTLHVVSRPTLAAPTLSGTDLTLRGSGGPPRDVYRVLASDDVTAPLASWTQVGTGTFDGSGNFSVTLGIVPGESRRFYAIVVP